MWAHSPVVVVSCEQLGSGSGIPYPPGLALDVVVGCEMLFSVPCAFQVVPVGQTREGLRLLVDGLAAPFVALRLRVQVIIPSGSRCGLDSGPSPVVAGVAGHQGEGDEGACC